jgi:hypothetical protein
MKAWSEKTAFLVGYTEGRRAVAYRSAREALDAHPSGLDQSNVAIYLNGFEDGILRDSFRYKLMRAG